MGTHKTTTVFSLFTFIFLFAITAHAQDKVYTSAGQVMVGKVTEVGPKQIRMVLDVNGSGPNYVFNVTQVDSIVYSNGVRDILAGTYKKQDAKKNIPQLNTWTINPLGFAFISLSQSYERRLPKHEWLGLRVPLYISFLGGNMAGLGMFRGNEGVFYANSNKGFGIATGINPKFYFINRRKIRPFAGPELVVGYDKYHDVTYDYANGDKIISNVISKSGTIAVLGKVGLSLNPRDKFNLTIDGGAGVANMFGGSKALGTIGVWQIGVSLGVNF